jgi:CheY-like chemotaxis protein
VSQGESVSGLRVIIVDDDPLVLAVTRRVLMRVGYSVAAFEDGPSALRDLAEHEPFAVVADLQMPGMNGTQLLAQVAQLVPRARRLLYTGEGDSQELERSLPAELAHAVVPKANGMRLLPDALERLRANYG